MKTRRVLRSSLMIALFLVISILPITAFATTSRTFFIQNVSGYTCTGRGIIYDYSVSATFRATENVNEPLIPPEACSANIWVTAYDSYGNVLGSENKNGKTTVEASVACTNTYKIMCGYLFNGTSLAPYELYAN